MYDTNVVPIVVITRSASTFRTFKRGLFIAIRKVCWAAQGSHPGRQLHGGFPGVGPCRGLTPTGSFMVGSRVEDLEECVPTATAFPAGSLFTSAGTSRAEHSGQNGVRPSYFYSISCCPAFVEFALFQTQVDSFYFGSSCHKPFSLSDLSLLTRCRSLFDDCQKGLLKAERSMASLSGMLSMCGCKSYLYISTSVT